MPDFYEVLQVSPRAEPDVIRAAYRVLARKHHPDHGGDRSRMVAINDAWDVLGDPVRRAEYDASRASAGVRGSWSPQRGPEADSRPATTNTAAVDPNHAGPPPGNPSGTVLDFGRFSGWSLGEIARIDPGYLEWLQRMTFGRRLRVEIESLLRQPGVHRSPAGNPGPFGCR
jgi:curved DNA-binding protein CbpA